MKKKIITTNFYFKKMDFIFRIERNEKTKTINNYSLINKNIKYLNILEPSFVLPSKIIKRYKDENTTLFNYYTDLNKKNIINILAKHTKTFTRENVFSKIEKVSKTKRYFIKTDLIGAFFNLTFNDIKSTLKYYNIEKKYYDYLISFYEYIKETFDEEHEYLYISDYSPYIFKLFLGMVLKDYEIIDFFDDIIIYDNDKKDLIKKFNSIMNILKEYNLFINKNKTEFIDTMNNSIYFLKTIITTPKNNILDENIKKIIKEKVYKGEKIFVWRLNNLLYHYIEEVNSITSFKVILHTFEKFIPIKKVCYNFIHWINTPSNVKNRNRNRKYYILSEEDYGIIVIKENIEIENSAHYHLY